MLVVKRNQVIIICLAVLVAAAGYLNWSFREDAKETAAKESVGEIRLVSEEEPSDYFEAARLERDISRANVRETLAQIIDDENAQEQSKAKAQDEVMNVAKQSDTENTVESLIRAKGYEDAVVYISEGKANAVVRAAEMTSEDATQIAEIITQQTGVPATEIKITCAQ